MKNSRDAIRPKSFQDAACTRMYLRHTLDAYRDELEKFLLLLCTT